MKLETVSVDYKNFEHTLRISYLAFTQLADEGKPNLMQHYALWRNSRSVIFNNTASSTSMKIKHVLLIV